MNAVFDYCLEYGNSRNDGLLLVAWLLAFTERNIHNQVPRLLMALRTKLRNFTEFIEVTMYGNNVIKYNKLQFLKSMVHSALSKYILEPPNMELVRWLITLHVPIVDDDVLNYAYKAAYCPTYDACMADLRLLRAESFSLPDITDLFIIGGAYDCFNYTSSNYQIHNRPNMTKAQLVVHKYSDVLRQPGMALSMMLIPGDSKQFHYYDSVTYLTIPSKLNDVKHIFLARDAFLRKCNYSRRIVEARSLGFCPSALVALLLRFMRPLLLMFELYGIKATFKMQCRLRKICLSLIRREKLYLCQVLWAVTEIGDAMLIRRLCFDCNWAENRN